MHGYSDRISHALTYLAKHYHPRAPASAPLPFVAHPSNVAIILARHGAEETTIVASILHHLLEIAPPSERSEVEAELRRKFGPVAIGVAGDAATPRVDADGYPLDWRHRKRVILVQLATMEPRSLDIRCAGEIHECGSAVSVAGRLGAEYLELHGHGHRRELMAWYDDLTALLERRNDWPSTAMRMELVHLTSQLRRVIGDL